MLTTPAAFPLPPSSLSQQESVLQLHVTPLGSSCALPTTLCRPPRSIASPAVTAAATVDLPC